MKHRHFESFIQFWLSYSLRLGRSRVRLGWASGLAWGAIALSAPLSFAASLTQWHYDPTKNQLEITVPEGTTPKYFLMAQPARIVMDLPNTEVGDIKLKETYDGAVRQVRVSQFQPGLTRIVLELSPEVALTSEQVKLHSIKGSNGSDRWVLSPLIAKTAALPSAESSTKPSPAVLPGPAGSDVSPVNTEPLPTPISVPPLNNSSTLAAVSPKATVPSLDTPPQAVAQLPVEATTPLPPVEALPPSGLDINTQNAVPVTVPPVALPTVQTGGVIDLPSTVRVVPGGSTQINVPPLSPVIVKIPASSDPAQLPAPMPVPPLNRVVVPGASVSTMPLTTGSAQVSTVNRLKPPDSSVMQGSAIGQSPTAIPPQPVGIPPSSVIQTSGGGVIQVTAPPISSAPIVGTLQPTPPQAVTPPTSVIKPPPSSVMQGSPAAVPPSPRVVIQPPVSSVMQAPIAAVPTTTMPFGSAATISVPPLQVEPTNSAIPNSAPPTVSVPPLQSTTPPTGVAPTVTVPPLKPVTAPAATGFPAPPLVTAPGTSTVEFGKPLPLNGATSLNTIPRGVPQSLPANGWQQPTYFQSATPGVVLPMGTVLQTTYSGTAETTLEVGTPWQDVLLLQTEVRDTAGTVIFPQGSYVLGEFTSDRNGSKFTTVAIRTGDRVVLMKAESEVITGNRDLSATNMALYSGAGALAGGLISRFSGLGLLLGGAAGAATNFFTAPKPAVLQPGQIIPIRVLQEVR